MGQAVMDEGALWSFFDFYPHATVLADLDTGRVVKVNDQFHRLTAYPKEECGEGPLGGPLPCSEGDWRQLLEVLKAAGEVRGMEMDLRTRKGSVINTVVFARPLEIHGRIMAMTVFSDVTEKKRLEAQLRQAQKMGTLGSLSVGTAHGLNNILGIIIANIELAVMAETEGSPSQACLLEVHKAGLWARDLVKQILGFARQSPTDLKPIRIGPVIKETLHLLRASIPHTIEIQQNITSDSAMVLADPTQINQILMNLCANASHAMKEKGGVLGVNLQRVTLNRDSRCPYRGLSPGKYVRLTVTDMGQGVPAEIIDRIFEPYFTTKRAGDGIGIGLSVVREIVKNYHGEIFVKSEPGKGSRFDVFLPQLDGQAVKETGETISEEEARGLGIKGYISKPVVIGELDGIIGKVLGEQ